MLRMTMSIPQAALFAACFALGLVLILAGLPRLNAEVASFPARSAIKTLYETGFEGEGAPETREILAAMEAWRPAARLSAGEALERARLMSTLADELDRREAGDADGENTDLIAEVRARSAEALTQALSRAPVHGRAWFALARSMAVSGVEVPRLQEALRLSYYAAPVDTPNALQRVWLALELRARGHLPEDLIGPVKRDLETMAASYGHRNDLEYIVRRPDGLLFVQEALRSVPDRAFVDHFVFRMLRERAARSRQARETN